MGGERESWGEREREEWEPLREQHGNNLLPARKPYVSMRGLQDEC